ncbi:hypothetical protein [Candidatus Mycoplasma haematohominis]|uniref:Uncharacterized protein n=1 Tax=Candidatus Mycoplasma haematohominis TaxID=1494318 RepID=A0A478FUY8_9MOLU|nr:hypothetical protein [Candidatus Mycoplasma haemohominis]GCE63945.1 hypothetical protein MHSWG343_09520 [Candidatus Mycoplasma haemohominis]
MSNSTDFTVNPGNPDLKVRQNTAFSALSLKWKRKHWYCLVACNICLTLLIVLDRILVSQGIKERPENIVVIALGLPAVMTLLLYYMKTATSEYRDFSTIIKKERLKYYYRGTACTFVSCNLTLLALVFSVCMGADSTAISAIAYTFIVFCMFLGVGSSALISYYEFCVCFDIFYHKNKETIIKEYLIRQHNLKILEEDEKEEDEEIEEVDAN